jgi:hypothetical protein
MTRIKISGKKRPVMNMGRGMGKNSKGKAAWGRPGDVRRLTKRTGENT